MSLTEHQLDCWAFAGWETDRQYRRAGMSSTVYFGNGAWIEQWRRRITSAETVKMLVECGVTIAVAHFYKGYGIQAESAEWPRLREFVGRCHEHGLKVWGYLQGGSLFYEALIEEAPEMMGWVARRYDGTPDTWGGAYYRLSPCLTSEPYREYVRRVIRIGLTEIGLDGIHNDNSYYKHCWCTRCAQRFREWLNRLPDLERRLGLPNADHVQPPPLPERASFADPMQIAWMEFGTQQRLAAYRGFYETVKACNPEAAYETNPAFPRQGAFKRLRALDPSREGRICDAVCAENGRLPRTEAGKVFSQAEAYLYADAGAYRVLSTPWVHTRQGSRPAETPALLWTGLAEEFSHHAALLGNNWLLRAAGDHDRILGDNESLRRTHAEAVRFFRELHQTLNLGTRTQWAEVGLLVEPDTLTLRSLDLLALRAALYWLTLNRIPVKFVYGGQSVPDMVRTLVVCQQSCLPEERLRELTAFARKPDRRVILIGDAGRYDAWRIPRSLSDWHSWRRSKNFIADEGRMLAFSAGKEDYAGQVEPSPEAVQVFRRLLDGLARTCHFQAALPGFALLNTELAEDGRLLIHVREQSGSGEAVEGGVIRLGEPLIRGKRCIMHAPGQSPQTLIENPQGAAEVRLPDFRHYMLLIVAY